MKVSQFLKRGSKANQSVFMGLLTVFAIGFWVSAPSRAHAEGTNLALTATASASTYYSASAGFEPSRINDGKDTTRWNDDCSETNPWVELDWPSAVTIGSVDILEAYDRVKTYTLDTWDSSKNDWVTAYNGTAAATGRIDINVDLTATLSPPVTTTKIRFSITEKSSCASIWEFRVYAPEKIDLALSGTASASTYYSASAGFEPSRVNDGKETTRWNDDCSESNPSVEIDWPTAVTLNESVIVEAYDRVKSYTLDAWDSSKNDWVTVYNGTAPGTGRIDINMTLVATFATPVTTTKLRFSIVDKTSCASIWEWYIYDIKFGTITGKVLDDAGKPIAGATATAGAVSSITGADGVYTLVVDPGTIDVKVTNDPTYKSRTARGIVVGDSATVNKDITLFKNPTDLAKGATPLVSSEDTGTTDADGNLLYDGTKLLDGILTTYWQSSEGEGVTFGVQSDAALTFNQVLIYERGNIINKLTLQKYDDAKSAWTDLQTQTYVTGNGDPVLKFSFAQPVTAKQIQAVVPTGGITISSQFSTVSAYEFVVQSAPLGTLKVTVQDYSTKKPIPNASVVTDDGSTLGVTDSTGVLSLPIDANDYELSATADGYFEGPSVIATVDSGATASVTISLPPKGDNLALKAKATASSDDGNTPDWANDGKMDTYWGSAGTEDGYIAGALMNAWVQFDWTAAVTFNRVVIYEYGDRSREIDVQVLDPTTSALVDVGQTVSPGGGADTEITHTVDLSSPATTKQLRIFVPTGANTPRFREVQAYSFTPVPASTTTTTTATLGDINADGKVNVSDATLSLRIAVGLLTPTDAQKTADDVNKDGKLSVADTTLILQVAVGVKTGF